MTPAQKAAALAIATAIAIPAEGLRQRALRQPKRLKFCRPPHKPAVNSLGFDTEFFAPLSHDHTFAAVFNPSCITSNVRSSLWCNPFIHFKGFEFSPPCANSAVNSLRVDSYSFRPLNNRFSLSFYSNNSAVTPIALIVFSANPSAIVFTIPKIVVDAVDSKPNWRLTHIPKEIRKISPFFANGYTSTAVVIPLLKILVSTSLDHPIPNAIGFCSVFPVPSVSVLCTSFGCQLSRQTSAAFSFPGCEILRRCSRLIPARAQAIPMPFIGLTDCCKPAKNTTGKVFFSTFREARDAAKKTIPCGKLRARKLNTAMGANLCNYRHKPSKKITQGL